MPRPPPLSSGGAPRSVTALSTAARVGALATSTPAALQPPVVPDRPRPARGPLAAALQAQPCDRAEMFLARGCPFSQDAVRDWEARFAPPMVALAAGQAARPDWGHRACRRNLLHDCWGAVLSVSGHRSRRQSHRRVAQGDPRHRAAQTWFRQADATVGQPPTRVTTDGHTAYPGTIGETRGQGVAHRTSHCKNNRIEQDHHGVRRRSYPTRGFRAVSRPPVFVPPSRKNVSRSTPRPGAARTSRLWTGDACSWTGGRPLWPPPPTARRATFPPPSALCRHDRRPGSGASA